MKYFNRIFISIFIIISLIGCSEKNGDNPLFDSDGMIKIEGTRTFIIGSYHHPKTANPFKELYSNGYNFVRAIPNKALLDSASKFNLRTWISTGSVKEKDSSDSIKIIELVNSYKNHPSLLSWEIEDEPAWTWNSAEPRITPEKMLESYELIKSHDPKHLVYTNQAPTNLVSTIKKYNSSTDIVACDIYPVIPHGISPTYALFPDGLQGDLLNTYISQVGEYVDKMKKVTNNSKPIFMVLQGFSWEMLKPSGSRDLSMIKYPTYEENRFMAFNAIVHGANGIIYWGTHYTPQPSQFMNDLNKVTRALSSMQEILASKNISNNIQVVYHEMGHSVDAGVEMILKKINKKNYLITTNSDKNPIKVTFSVLSDFSRITVLSENRNLKIIDGKFTDNFDPFDVHIYEYE